MDLTETLIAASKNGTLDLIKNGFENSQFGRDVPDCGGIVKHILEKLNKNNPLKCDVTTVNGVLSVSDADKKNSNSFSNEFQIMCTNLLILCGYELSYNYSILLSLPNIIEQYAEHIKTATDYETILNNILALKNLYSREEVCVEKFQSNFMTEDDNSFVFNFNDSVQQAPKNEFFENICKHVKNGLDNNHVSIFVIHKQQYIKEIDNLVKNTRIENILVEDVNDLLHNIGNKPVYDSWFIKAWSLLYDELLVDCRNCKLDVHPLEELYINLNLNTYKTNYISRFTVYLDQVLTETKNSITEVLGEDGVAEIEISRELITYLSEMMLNLYTNIAYELFHNQHFNHATKSSRVHYSLLYFIIINCKPRLFMYSQSQLNALRYILLPKKSIMESIEVLSKKKLISAPVTTEKAKRSKK